MSMKMTSWNYAGKTEFLITVDHYVALGHKASQATSEAPGLLICRKVGFRIPHMFCMLTVFLSVTAESGIRHPSIWKRLSAQEIWGTASLRNIEEKDTEVFYSKSY